MNTRKLFVALFGVLIYTSPFVSPTKAQQLPLNQLVIKGTHNSYACCGGESFFGWDNSCPVMHNPPNEQMDDWNVWALELDFSTEILNGIPTLIVGHDGPSGEDSFTTPDWGGTLSLTLLLFLRWVSCAMRALIRVDCPGDMKPVVGGVSDSLQGTRLGALWLKM